jgi:hypothetical protein
MNRAWRNDPPSVHSVNATCATREGFTQTIDAMSSQLFVASC